MAKKKTAKKVAKAATNGTKPKVRARELAAQLAVGGIGSAIADGNEMEPEAYAQYCMDVAVLISDMNETAVRAGLRGEGRI